MHPRQAAAARALREGRHDLALRLLSTAPAGADTLWLKGRVLSAQAHPEAAQKTLAQALAIAPHHIGAATDLAQLSVQQDQPALALQLTQQVLRRHPHHAGALHARGLALRAVERLPEAIATLRAAHQAAPRDATILANLAAAAESVNRNAEAEVAARRALALSPSHGLAVEVLAGLMLHDRRLAEAEDLLDAWLAKRAYDQPASQVHGWAHCTRGKVRDRLGNAAGALHDFTVGQGILDSLVTGVDRAHFPALLRALQASVVRGPTTPAPAPVSSRAPAFLVGFPRSGTTLTERLLAAHPAIDTLDEQEVLVETIQHAATVRPGFQYPRDVSTLTPTERAALASFYAKRLSHHGLTLDGPRTVVDKLPLNLVHLAFIRQVFPDAAVILAIRDPRDCCLSAFMQTFRPTVAMVHTSRLDSTVDLYAQAMTIGLTVADWPGLRVHRHRYEDVVSDVEGSLRSAVAHLGLPWDDRVLTWHARAQGAHIRTPSHQDVSRPIFTRARGRWMRYREAFAPHADTLDPIAKRLGYPATLEH